MLFNLNLWGSRMKRIIKSITERSKDYEVSINRSKYYYNKIEKNSIEFYMDFKQTRNFPEVLDWLQENVRNISITKTRRFGTAWWLFKDRGQLFHTIGFKNPNHAILFKLSGHYFNIEYSNAYEW